MPLLVAPMRFDGVEETMISLIFQVVHHDSKVQSKTKFLQSLISVLEIAGTYTIQKINSLNL